MKLIFLLFAIFAATKAEINWDKLIDLNDVYPQFRARGFPLKFGHTGRVTGGQEATPHQFPYQVAVFLQLPQGQAFCGGSLISQNYVLTAAHCADGVSNFTVILGAHNVRENEPTQVEIQSREKTVHKSWNPNTLSNDIALIKLPNPVELNDNIQTVNLPGRDSEGNSFAGDKSIISGWGKPSDSASGISPVMRWVEHPVLTNDECQKKMLNLIEIVDTLVCADGAGGKSACNGDSGGPLVVKGEDGKPMEIGVVSFGLIFGCEKGFPGAYTRVTKYLDWIQDNSDVVIN